MNEKFGDKIFTPQQARRYSGIYETHIAKKLGISTATYINKEKGKTRFYVDEAIKFSKIVGIPFENIEW